MKCSNCGGTEFEMKSYPIFDFDTYLRCKSCEETYHSLHRTKINVISPKEG